jgi:hypothetical protein
METFITCETLTQVYRKHRYSHRTVVKGGKECSPPQPFIPFGLTRIRNFLLTNRAYRIRFRTEQKCFRTIQKRTVGMVVLPAAGTLQRYFLSNKMVRARHVRCLVT